MGAWGGAPAPPPSYDIFRPPLPKPMASPIDAPPLKNESPHLKNNPPPPLKYETPFHEMIPRKSTINKNLKSS